MLGNATRSWILAWICVRLTNESTVNTITHYSAVIFYIFPCMESSQISGGYTSTVVESRTAVGYFSTHSRLFTNCHKIRSCQHRKFGHHFGCFDTWHSMKSGCYLPLLGAFDWVFLHPECGLPTPRRITTNSASHLFTSSGNHTCNEFRILLLMQWGGVLLLSQDLTVEISHEYGFYPC